MKQKIEIILINIFLILEIPIRNWNFSHMLFVDFLTLILEIPIRNWNKSLGRLYIFVELDIRNTYKELKPTDAYKNYLNSAIY